MEKEHKTTVIEKYIGAGYPIIFASASLLAVISIAYSHLEGLRTTFDKNGVVTKAGHPLVDLAFQYQDKTTTILLLLFSFGVIFSFAAKWAHKIWKDSIKPSIETKFDDFGDNVSNLIRANSIEKCLENTSKENTLSTLKLLMKNIYGRHCVSEKSLATAVLEHFSPYYDRSQPHRSGYDKTVKIADKGNGFYGWSETCRYDVHCVQFDNDYHDPSIKNVIDQPTFNLKYYSKAEVGEITCQEDLLQHDVRISADHEIKFTSAQNLRYESGKIHSDCDAIKLATNKDKRHLEIQYEKDIPLEKPWTSIAVDENSVVKENFYILKIPDPMYGATITIVIPDGWHFIDVETVSYPKWEVSHTTQNTIKAIAKGWILPGMVFYCSWGK